MSTLWLYQIPLWLLAILIIGATVVYTLVGLLATRRWVLSLPGVGNDSVASLLSIAGVAYAVLLAMIAVGAWDGVAAVETAVQEEANALGGIHRNLEAYRPAERERLRALVRDYVDFVVRDEWPALQRGRASPRTELAAQMLHGQLTTFAPQGDAEALVHPLVLEEANEFTDARRLRLLLGTRGLDPITWFVVVLGGLITIGFSFFFRTDSVALHTVVSSFASGMLGLLIFLIVAMDHPLWGDVSVQPEPFRDVLRQATVAETVR